MRGGGLSSRVKGQQNSFRLTPSPRDVLATVDVHGVRGPGRGELMGLAPGEGGWGEGRQMADR